MPLPRSRPAQAAALLAALLAAAPCAAQSVAGELVDRAQRAPVRGALVVLLDESGTQRARALTTATGSFALKAPGAGRYRVRAERVGFASTTSPVLELAEGETLRFRLEAEEVPISLEEVTVAVRGRDRGPGGLCRVRPGDGEATAALWEEARKALNASVAVDEGRLLRYEVLLRRRELDPGDLKVISEETRRGTSQERSAFVSIPAAQLAAEGYIRRVADGTFFYAPDAGVLLSDEFLDGHCFRIAEGDPPEPGLVGLAFQPVRARHPDVAGTLWLNRATSELKLLEFRYTDVPADVDVNRLGGRVEFDRLPSGEWFVRRWWIRMPTIGMSVTHFQLPRMQHERRAERQTLLTLREDGGEVVATPTGAVAAVPTGRLEGTVFDSLSGRPLEGATVFISGTQYSARTDSAGAFAIDGVPEGSYSASFSHPGLAEVGITPAVQTVTVRPAGTEPLRLAVPSLRGVVANLCPEESLRRHRGVVMGRVTAADGAPVVDARVFLRWTRMQPVGNVRGIAESLEAKSDAEGYYRACGVPPSLAMRVEVTAGGAVARLGLNMGGETAVRQNFRVGSGAVLAADGDGRPIALAGVEGVARPVARTPEMRAFEDRRRRGMGVYLDREQIERLQPRDATDLFRHVPGVNVIPIPGGLGYNIEMSGRTPSRSGSLPPPPSSRLKDSNSDRLAGLRCGGASQPSGGLTGGQSGGQGGAAEGGAENAECFGVGDVRPQREVGTCPVLFFMNGMPLHLAPGQSLSTEVHPDEIEAIEVYRRAAEVPALYARPGSECGVVLIWTRARHGSS